MKSVLVIAFAVACGKEAPARPPPAAPPPPTAPSGSPPSGAPSPGPATADPLLRSVPHPVPPGPYRVAYDCGPANQQRIDLRAKTRSTIANGSPAPVISTLPDAMTGMVRDSVAHVLAGGPYRAEPGACTLSIETADGAPVFSIEKSGHTEKDAVSELQRAFAP